MAHAALPALLPTPPKWNMLRLLPTPCAAAIVPKPPLGKPSRSDAVERWDARKTKPACTETKASSLFPRKNATSPPPKPGRADAVERWDAHKKAASPPSSSSSSGKKCTAISRASSSERWDVHKKQRSSTGSNDMEDEEILWKPRAMYAGPGFVGAAPEPSMIPMPAFLVPVA